ncbi:hypothetical protein [uncultured Methanomethylovorans sp.]|uniref:vWA domain-containing protein n=1 Tax=uncultured Methanomethylovorans sp. TaxID=183759 RepID=UPI002AA74C21|nr:hypothetical protein [uncultured Methanomethylovorans sp.]
MTSLGNPQMLWLMIPLLAAGIYLILKGAKKGLIISRMIVLALLIVALASPYSIVSKVSNSENPDIVLISDETSSMELFEQQTATDLYESLAANTPTNIVKLTGESTALGDAIVQYARGDNQIVLVSDGNNNKGEDLEESLNFANEMGTTVYSVIPDLKTNDVSLYINGEKKVVQDNEYQFNLIVQQAGDTPASCQINVLVDDKPKMSNYPVSLNDKSKTIPVTHTFDSVGAHTITASITVSGEDSQPINNVFYKTVYVVPKPKIQFITDDTSSPMANVLLNLYDTSLSTELTDLDNKKAVVLDNRNINSLSETDINNLKNYVSSGNGLYVVGGDSSYNYGNYLNSSLETILPVYSKASEWKGGRNVVLVLDISSSTINQSITKTEGSAGVQGNPVGDEIKANAISILRNKGLRDANVGVIAFGTEGTDVSNGLVYFGVPSNIDQLESKILSLTPSLTSQTSLDSGLSIADEWLKSGSGELDVIIVSDGGISDYYTQSLEVAKKLAGQNVKMYFVHIFSTATQYRDPNTGLIYGESLMKAVNGTYFQIKMGERVNLVFDELEQPETNVSTDFTVFPLVKYNPTHFITKNVNLSANITGYNDVTPKPGADRLLITSTGKPVLTVWRYGLGRVASLSTDNGKGNDNMWSTQMYSGNNSKLTSSTMNWLIGDPQIEEGAVLEADDTWFGTPAQLKLTMYDEGVPSIKLDDGKSIDLSLTGKNTYEATTDIGQVGVHYISGYPIAVNYALEYRDVGVNPDLAEMIMANGGKTYTKSGAQALLLKDAREKIQKPIKETVSQKMYFIITALIIFLLEVAIRRLREIKEMKEQEKKMQEVTEA